MKGFIYSRSESEFVEKSVLDFVNLNFARLPFCGGWTDLKHDIPSLLAGKLVSVLEMTSHPAD